MKIALKEDSKPKIFSGLYWDVSLIHLPPKNGFMIWIYYTVICNYKSRVLEVFIPLFNPVLVGVFVQSRSLVDLHKTRYH